MMQCIPSQTFINEKEKIHLRLNFKHSFHRTIVRYETARSIIAKCTNWQLLKLFEIFNICFENSSLKTFLLSLHLPLYVALLSISIRSWALAKVCIVRVSPIVIRKASRWVSFTCWALIRYLSITVIFT